MSARGLVLATLVWLCASVGALAFASASADAVLTHKYLSQISEIPEGEAGSITFDSGDLWVGENGHKTGVDEFDASTGAFLEQLEYPASVRGGYPKVAVGHTGETQVYVGNYETSDEAHDGVVDVFGVSGKLMGTWTGADTPSGTFGYGGVQDVAVDDSALDWAAGDVYVAVTGNEHAVDVFKPGADGKEEYVTRLRGTCATPGTACPASPVPFSGPDHVTVDQGTGEVLVTDGSGNEGEVDVFEPTGLDEFRFVRQLTGTSNGLLEGIQDVAVDPDDGDVYVTAQVGGSVEVDEFGAAGEYLGRLTGALGRLDGAPGSRFTDVRGVAVDSSHHLYVGSYSEELHSGAVDVYGENVVLPDPLTEPASNLKLRSATLAGTVDPDEAGEATCEFELGTSTEYGQRVPCAAHVANGGAAVAVEAQVSGLQPGVTYHYRLDASNAAGTNIGEGSSNVGEFTTAGPKIDSESAVEVTSSSASLQAQINPKGAATSYYFQYGEGASYGSVLPVAPGLEVGSGEGDRGVSVLLQGLAAGRTYHYRVVALSEPGGEPVVLEGADQTFTTQTAGLESLLPDGRAWEMVSPPDKRGALIGGALAEVQAAEDGSGITYSAFSPFVEDPAGTRSPEFSQELSRRQAPGVWGTLDLDTPHEEGATSIASSPEYKLFSSDLSRGFLDPHDDTPLPPLPAGSEHTLYARNAAGEYEALVTPENVAPGTHFGHEEGGNQLDLLTFESATPDGSHVAIASGVALTPGGAPGLYEWMGGRIEYAGVPGRDDLGGSFSRDAISDDGSRMVVSALEKAELYLSDMARGGEAILVGHESHYMAASSTDSRVFFTSGLRLTPDSTAFPSQGAGREDLYVFEVTSGASEPLVGTLTDLTVDGSASEPPGVRTANVEGVIGASEDGGEVYFVAEGVLGDAADKGAGKGHNLYLERYDEARGKWAEPVFIAALAGNDAPSWGVHPEQASVAAGANESSPREMTARVSPDGRYLAFMSELSLTGYDSADAASGVRDEEVFLYDGSTGRLVCASCDPTGARPVGLLDEPPSLLVDEQDIWTGRWLAGNVPALSFNSYQPRYLSDGGRLFFDSSDALVPGDVNGKEDVYEYEPAGVGSCQPPGYGQGASVVFSEGAGGCVGLVSAGTSKGESAFIDASASGGDVFFLTTSQLAPQDYDSSLDVYDAHECSVAEPCAPPAAPAPPPCSTGDACKPGPTPQPSIFGEPASATFSGAGNVAPSATGPAVTRRSAGQPRKLAKALRACRRGSKRKRAVCEARARRRYGAKGSRVDRGLPGKPRALGAKGAGR